MAQAMDTFGILHENLVDAGCDENTVNACMTMAKAENKAGILRLLAKQRESLLQAVHTGQKQIDCLDFLVYSIQRELRSES